ncbi:hypothetical protein L1049_018694 [Liquidambar formosana]|uniref:NAD-dependent epimerase/dehydratase domain-containing protein n=1 Tax=Liquidambar formosana TaxID=63359 RepID=A0AAP0RAF1_LIQFO
MAGDKGSVCVTGGTGYVATWLVMRLLQHGYSVRATVRSDPERKKDISYLTNLPGASEKLQIFNADLDQPDSFDAAIEGCIGVFHVAHPIDLTNQEPEEVVTKRAVEGTLGILNACLKSKTVKRVVYTSSAATIMFNGKGLDYTDETMWSDLDICRRRPLYPLSYLISKTESERTALEFGEKHGLEVVSVILTLVVGPFISPTLPVSGKCYLPIINAGNEDQYQYLLNTHMVHIDDVASAHIFLFECPNAKGRYICSSDEVTIQAMIQFLSANYPEVKIPDNIDTYMTLKVTHIYSPCLEREREREREMEEDKGIVCVTGGTGHVASWLIMKLLQHGYSVRATVRSDPPDCKKDISFLTSLPRATEKLQIYNADLNKPDSFDAPIKGCIGVFHVAHPMDQDNKEPEEIVTKRAVEGTLGILNACLNSKTVKRVVYTSSAVTVMVNNKGLRETDESTWSDIDICRSQKLYSTSYLVSKTVTERTALEFADKHGLDLVTLVLPLVVGPFICPRMPASVSMALAMILGNQDQYQYLINLHMVHIDDLASAHIFVFEYPNAKGRYICSSVEITIHRMFEFLLEKYPDVQIPSIDHLEAEIKAHKISSLSSKKLLESGFKFKFGLDEIFDGTIQCCKEKGFL